MSSVIVDFSANILSCALLVAEEQLENSHAPPPAIGQTDGRI